MFRFLSGFKQYLIGGALILALGTGAILWYKNTRNQIKLLETEKAIAAEANDTLRNTLDRVQAETERLDQLRNDLNRALENATTSKEDLQRILNDHDLENLSREKPGLIEKRINDSTKNVFDQLEFDTAK